MKPIITFLLITLQPGRSHEVLDKIRAIAEVKFAYIVTGPYDIICFLEGDTAETLTRLVIERVHPIPGIVRTMTCLVVDD